MSKPIIRIVELDGTILDREMTATEFTDYQEKNQQALAVTAEAEAKTAAKAALLNRLGITADEAKLLLS